MADSRHDAGTEKADTGSTYDGRHREVDPPAESGSLGTRTERPHSKDGWWPSRGH